MLRAGTGKAADLFSSICDAISPSIRLMSRVDGLYSVLKFLKITAIGLVALPVLAGAHMGIGQLTGNFHEVIPASSIVRPSRAARISPLMPRPMA